tara:strand:- start:499 stop:672 length:174 start_codon:yes stop_codon:yes gene_type:complete
MQLTLVVAELLVVQSVPLGIRLNEWPCVLFDFWVEKVEAAPIWPIRAHFAAYVFWRV